MQLIVVIYLGGQYTALLVFSTKLLISQAKAMDVIVNILYTSHGFCFSFIFISLLKLGNLKMCELFFCSVFGNHFDHVFCIHDPIKCE